MRQVSADKNPELHVCAVEGLGWYSWYLNHVTVHGGTVPDSQDHEISDCMTYQSLCGILC